ncbi:MAG: hypothetical protein Q7S47_01850 [bacterium]|nr:hypothetical protein [bacterium]
MKKDTHDEHIISTREFLRDFTRIATKPHCDQYRIVKHGKPVGVFVPERAANGKAHARKYVTLADLEKTRFKSGKKNLSTMIDRIAYGR